MQQLDLFASLFDTSSQKKKSEEQQAIVEKKEEVIAAEKPEETPFSLVELAEETLGIIGDETIQTDISDKSIVYEPEDCFVPSPEDQHINEKLSEVIPSEETISALIPSAELQVVHEASVEMVKVDVEEIVVPGQKETYQPNSVRNGTVIFDDGKISVKVKSRPAAVTFSPAVPAVDAIDVAQEVKKEPQKRGRKPIKEIEAEADLIEVPEDEVLFKKQYYSISEVAKWFRVNTSLLRFWENEFDILKPRKNRKGDRLFRPEDVKSLQLIYQLLRQRKYTIEGAKDYIKTNRKKADIEMQLVNSLQKFRSFLLDLRANL